MPAAPDRAEELALPAWSLPADREEAIALPPDWPHEVTRDWAWGGSRGEGVRVCILDSGVERDHPLVGPVQDAVVLALKDEHTAVVEPDDLGDLTGHGTACAGIIRSLAPACEITSMRVLGPALTGSGTILVAALQWAIEQEFDVLNLSLSTSKRDYAAVLHELADSAYFRRTMLVASAHNLMKESFPWRFSSVVSVGSHERPNAFDFFYNPDPPVEFFARGVDVDVAWSGGGQIRATGNSFATPHIAGICALILGKHPGLTPFALKSVLYLTATNVGEGR